MKRHLILTRASLVGAALFACTALYAPGSGTAAPLNQAPLVAPAATQATPLYTEVQRRRVAQRGAVAGPRGGAVRRTTVAGPRGVARRTVVSPGRPGSRPGRWARPGRYWWRPGGAIAAGAAIGYLGATAVSWASAPAPGMCWYYTDRSRRQGFWDSCP
jgi:hypothetical protein